MSEDKGALLALLYMHREHKERERGRLLRESANEKMLRGKFRRRGLFAFVILGLANICGDWTFLYVCFSSLQLEDYMYANLLFVSKDIELELFLRINMAFLLCINKIYVLGRKEITNQITLAHLVKVQLPSS